jgi:hypothetical protein
MHGACPICNLSHSHSLRLTHAHLYSLFRAQVWCSGNVWYGASDTINSTIFTSQQLGGSASATPHRHGLIHATDLGLMSLRGVQEEVQVVMVKLADAVDPGTGSE